MTQSCNPRHFRRLSRRGFLSVGFLAGSSLTLPQLLARRAWADLKHYENFEGTAKSVIHIFLPGGMAHQESFDPKPHAPIEYRGEMKPIPTAISGEYFGETLPQTAKVADKLCIIRSMTHGEAAHERGTHNMFTGYRPSPAIQYPSIGSVVSHEFGPRNNLPPYVCIPSVPNEYAGSGYLSSAYAPFSLGSDPANNGFKVRDLDLPNGVDERRFTIRRTALEAVNAHFRHKEKSDDLRAMDTFYERAYSLLSSAEARAAFDLSKEPDAVRDEYGRNTAGARMLLARRLVQAGVRLVNLTYGGWDMHAQIVRGFRNQMPAFDQAFAALIRDLDRTGLLSETLVMVSSEFGRTPKINKDSGRDHWPKVFSVVLAGGGIKGGMIHGSSNATASEPEDHPVGPEDLFTTVYHCLGIVADKELMAPGDRPIEIVDGGQVLREILA
ncbi:MAG: sulfatase [Planctomycetaceae bacterium]|nr:MAG: sulfatase [Planctomycetaceae bacterium]